MNNETLRNLISRKEGLKPDFKQEIHINHHDKKTKEGAWAELIKDILALTNGNVGTADQSAYTISR